MKNFALWLLRKIGVNIISFPRAHFVWYKHGLYYETGLFILYTMGRFIATLIALLLLGIAINEIFRVRCDNIILGCIVFLFSYYVIEFFTVILSIQYDKYTKELQKTMDALKRTDYNDVSEEDTYFNTLASQAQAQKAFNHAVNSNIAQGYGINYGSVNGTQPVASSSKPYSSYYGGQNQP